MTTHPPSRSTARVALHEVPEPPALETALSADRFARYLDWADGDRARALNLYTLNARLCEALYIPLHAFEVALRNRIDRVMAAASGDRWFEDGSAVLLARQREQVASALQELAQDNKPADPGRVVAALTFSYWTSFFGTNYEQLWRTTLNAIAVRPDGRGLSRKDFARPCTQLRFLRNRVAHHEPILYWNLPKHHAALRELTQWLSPPLAAWSDGLDRFPAVHPPGRLGLTFRPRTEAAAASSEGP